MKLSGVQGNTFTRDGTEFFIQDYSPDDVRKAITLVYEHTPWLMPALQAVSIGLASKAEDPVIAQSDTGYTDCTSKIVIGTDGVFSKNREGNDLALFTLLVHELCHVGFGHYSRTMEMKKHDPNLNSQLLNIALDFEINRVIGQVAPNTIKTLFNPVTVDDIILSFNDPLAYRERMTARGIDIDDEDGNNKINMLLDDSKVGFLRAEKIYQYIWDRLEKKPQGGGGGSESGGGDGDEPQSGVPGSGDVKLDENSQTNGDAQNSEHLSRQVMGGLSEAIASGKLAGLGSTDFDRAVKDFIRPPYSAADAMEGAVSKIISQDRRSMRRPNRRILTYLRMMAPGRDVEETYNIAVCIDTSGSITQEELRMAAGDIVNIGQRFNVESTNVAYFDTKVKGDQVIDDPANLTPEHLKPVGGGGTDFVPIFRWASQEHPDVDVLVIITDGYASIPNKSIVDDVDAAVIWAILPGGVEKFKESLEKAGIHDHSVVYYKGDDRLK